MPQQSLAPDKPYFIIEWYSKSRKQWMGADTDLSFSKFKIMQQKT